MGVVGVAGVASADETDETSEASLSFMGQNSARIPRLGRNGSPVVYSVRV